MPLTPLQRVRILSTIALALAGVWLWVVRGVTPATVLAQTTEATQRLHEAAEPPLATKIGILRAHQRLGRGVPIGRGVVIGHVEGGPGEYTPNRSDAAFRGVEFVLRSGESQPFGHAQGVAKLLYGREGLAPGVTEVHSFTSAGWMMEDYLRANTAEPPVEGGPRLFNHSWISDTFPGVEQVLRRIDYQVDERDVVMVVGVNNNRDTKVPALLASAYNVIAVGLTSGNSSGGWTRVEGEGRSKPDIVAPHGLTSFATPAVAACVARLQEAAGELESHATEAGRAEVIKAVLMAGATKPDGWAPPFGKPLDEHLGVGQVNLDHALRVLQTGMHEPGPLRRRWGWDFRPLDPGGSSTYRFTITRPLGEASLVLAWHRRIEGRMLRLPEGQTVWAPVPRLADFDLRLIRVENEGESLRTVAFSSSAVDNVEHVYLPALEPGEYVVEVRRQPDGHAEAWDYALAWRFETP